MHNSTPRSLSLLIAFWIALLIPIMITPIVYAKTQKPQSRINPSLFALQTKVDALTQLNLDARLKQLESTTDVRLKQLENNIAHLSIAIPALSAQLNTTIANLDARLKRDDDNNTKRTSVAVPSLSVSGSLGIDALPNNRSFGEALVFYAPLANAVGLVLAGIAAFAFFFAVQIYQRRDQWLVSFRALYAEFWGDKHVAEARAIIVSTTCYNEILRPILNKRNASDDNLLDMPENEVIDKIDRFCAIMVRITSFSSTLREPDEFELWEKLFYDFWKNKVQPCAELKRYIDDHWKELKPTQPQRPRRLFTIR